MKKKLFDNYQITISKECLVSCFSNLFTNYNIMLKDMDIFLWGKDFS